MQEQATRSQEFLYVSRPEPDDVASEESRLGLRHISSAARETLQYIQDKKEGKLRVLLTPWKSLNAMCSGGLEWNCFYVLAGISGAGKSSAANSLETGLFDLNPAEDFDVLSLNYEMLSFKQVGRKISSKLSRTVSDLYSGSHSLSEEDFVKAKRAAAEVSRYRIWYSEMPQTVPEIVSLVRNFRASREPETGLVVIMDHSRLLRKGNSFSEQESMDQLSKAFMTLKKEGKSSFILLSQLNREIEKADRLNKPSGHFPRRGDIFGCDSLYQCADYVFVLHRPELLGLLSYGVHKWQTEGVIYWHVLKNRDGEPGIVPMRNNLKFNSLEEL